MPKVIRLSRLKRLLPCLRDSIFLDMYKPLFLFFLVPALPSLLSALPLEEGFEYISGQDLNDAVGGSGFVGAWNANANMDVYNYTWSAWPGYSSLANKATGPDDNGDTGIEASRALTTPINTELNQTFYFSYTLNGDVDDAGWTNLMLRAESSSRTGSDSDNFFIQYHGSQFYLNGDAGLSNDTKPPPDGGGRGVDYLVVGRIDFAADDDTGYMSVFAPGEDARAVYTEFETFRTTTITGTLTDLLLRMNNSSRVGNIRFGASLEEVGVSAPPPPPSRDPIVYFSFDEGTISGDQLLDQSGNGNHGTILNQGQTVTTNAVGAFGNAFFFPYGDNGEGAVTLPVGLVPSGNAPRTFACWFRQINDPAVDSISAQNKIFGYGSRSADPGTTGLESFDVSLRYDYTNSENDIEIRGWGGVHQSRDAGPRYEDEQEWQHLAIVVPDGATTFGEIQIYIDGVELPRNEGNSWLINTADTLFSIGTVISNNTSSNDYNGYIDEFYIYDIALTQQEVADLAAGTPAAIPGGIERFALSPRNRVTAGTSMTLSWDLDRVKAGTDVIVDNGIGIVSIDASGVGTTTFAAPATTTTYTLTMTDEADNVLTASTTVVVGDEGPLPNIILFLVDDMGWADWEHNRNDTVNGDYATAGINTGSTFYETPHMNTLAQEGMWFRNAYADSPVCSPTRAAIMTGQSAARSHVTDWITGRGDDDIDVYEAEWTKYLTAELRASSLPAMLARHGYRTIHVGKWHLGATGSPSDSPLDCGFDVNIGGTHLGTPPTFFADASGSFDLPELGAGSFPQYTYLTDALTTKAVAEIENTVTAGEAFFLYMSHYDVHAPIDAPKATADLYEAKLNANGGYDPDGDHAVFGGQQNSVYAAKVDHMDVSLGAIVAKLEELNVDENTLIIFYADNGGWESSPASRVEGTGGSDDRRIYLGSGSIIGEIEQRQATDNAPLHMGKGYLYEGGIREPALFWWPGRIPGAQIEDEPIVSRDLYTTIMEVAGVPLPAGHMVDGKSLTPLLGLSAGGFERPEGITIHYPHQSDQGGLPGSALIQGNWKLIHYYNYGGRPDFQGQGLPDYDNDGDASQQLYVLYDLANDIGETTDLAASESALQIVLQYDLVHGLTLMGANYPRSKGGVGNPAEFTPYAPAAGPNPDVVDEDGDGLNSREEAYAGSSDADARDGFSASLDFATGPALQISGRKGRIYHLYRSLTLEPGSWTWMQSIGPLTADGLVDLSDETASGLDRAFYRIELEL